MTPSWRDTRTARMRWRGGRASPPGAGTWTGPRVCGARPWNGIQTIPSFWSGSHRPSTGRVNPISRQSMRLGRARSPPRTARSVISRGRCAPHSGRRSRRKGMERATPTTMRSWRRKRRSRRRGSDLRGTLHAGWRYATLSDAAGNVITSGTSYGGGAYGIAALGQGAVLRAGLGARRVAPDGGRARTPLTAQLGLGLRPGRYTAVSLGYSRTPFDETAGLMLQDLTIDALDWSLDASPGAGWSLSAGGGGAWFSDGNRRYSAVGAVLGRVAKGLQIGPFARVMGYREPKPGLYFTPVRFSVIEGRGVYQWQRQRWGLRADGGLGSQQVQAFAAPTAPRQTEWHVGVSLSRGWGANNEIALVGSITNSAAAATAGAVTASFRYRTLGLRFRQGL